MTKGSTATAHSMRQRHSLPVIAAALAAFAAPAFAQRPPTTDDAKQALNRTWQKLKPTYVSERSVVYQDIRAGRATGASYPFKVSVLIRDYEPGYPPNHYYGKTCVGKIEDEVYTLELDAFNQWAAQGRMTPEMSKTECRNNPSAGVSSIPLASLSGSSASTGQAAPALQMPAPAPQTASPAAGAGTLAMGAYECWGNGQAHLTMNFTAQGANRYTGYNGQSGTYTVDSSNRVTFRGGPLDGVMPAGFYAVYYAPQGRPTVSFRSPRASEAAFCQKK